MLASMTRLFAIIRRHRQLFRDASHRLMWPSSNSTNVIIQSLYCKLCLCISCWYQYWVTLIKLWAVQEAWQWICQPITISKNLCQTACTAIVKHKPAGPLKKFRPFKRSVTLSQKDQWFMKPAHQNIHRYEGLSMQCPLSYITCMYTVKI